MSAIEVFKQLWFLMHHRGHKGYQEQVTWLAPIIFILAGFQGFLTPDSVAYELLGNTARLLLIIMIYILGCDLFKILKK